MSKLQYSCESCVCYQAAFLLGKTQKEKPKGAEAMRGLPRMCFSSYEPVLKHSNGFINLRILVNEGILHFHCSTGLALSHFGVCNKPGAIWGLVMHDLRASPARWEGWMARVCVGQQAPCWKPGGAKGGGKWHLG